MVGLEEETAAMSTTPSEPREAEKIAAQFLLERYKFILGELHSLNENIHRYLTLFQALATAIVAAGAALFVSWRKLEISADVARVTIETLLGVLIVLALFIILWIVSGIFSWLDYRNEEVKLLDVVVGQGARAKPSLGNFWRWHETYLLLLLVVIILGSYFFTQCVVIPAIK
jgi:hypothetical protein